MARIRIERDASGGFSVANRTTENRTYQPALPLGDGHDRGYGWEIIRRTPGIDEQDDIGEVLRAPNAVDEYGPYDIVIGETDEGDGIVLWLLGNTLVHSGQFIKDHQGRRVVIDRTNRHPVREDEDHPDSYDEIERAIRNPDEIWESGKSRFYVKQIDGRWLVVRTHFYEYAWIIGTAVYEGDSWEDVEDLLERKEFDIPGDKVYP